jgi:hypothetical protein
MSDKTWLPKFIRNLFFIGALLCSIALFLSFQ